MQSRIRKFQGGGFRRPVNHACVLLITLLISPQVSGQRWIALDAQARGMGHAGVASIDSPFSIYWNPARIDAGDGNGGQLQLDGFFDLNVEGDLVNSADRLSDLLNEFSLDAVQVRLNDNSFTPEDLQNTFSLVDTVASLTEPGAGIVADAGGGFAYRKDKWAFSYRFLTRVGLSGFVDIGEDSSLSITDDGLSDLNDGIDLIIQDRLLSGLPLNLPQTPAGDDVSRELIATGGSVGLIIPREIGDEFAFQAEQALGDRINDPGVRNLLTRVLEVTSRVQPGNSNNFFLTDNNSGVEFKGIKLHELAVGRSFATIFLEKPLSLGISARLLFGETFLRIFNYREINDGEQLVSDIFNSFNHNTESSIGFTMDAGLNYAVLDSVNVALSVRNLVPEEFEFNDGSTFHLDPQVRAGLRFRHKKLPWLTVSFDADLTKNDTDTLPGFESRILGGGAELASSYGDFSFALRAGCFANIAARDTVPVYTFGTEFGYGSFYINAEGYLSFAELDIESQSAGTPVEVIPERLGASFSIGYNF